jgi:hypothetical protein
MSDFRDIPWLPLSAALAVLVAWRGAGTLPRGSAGLEEFAEIEKILRRHGIS